MQVTAIVVRDGRDYTDEMFVIGEGLKTLEEMRKYRHVNYNPDLYYDKQTEQVINQAVLRQEKSAKDFLQKQVKEEILGSGARFIRTLRRG